MAKFAIVDTPVRIRGGISKMSESMFRAIIYAPAVCFRFSIYSSVSKPGCFKGDWDQSNFAVLTPVRIRGGLGKISELIVRATPRTQPPIYSTFDVALLDRPEIGGRLARNSSKAKHKCLQIYVVRH